MLFSYYYCNKKNLFGNSYGLNSDFYLPVKTIKIRFKFKRKCTRIFGLAQKQKKN